MKAAKTQKKMERNAISIQKKLLKRKGNSAQASQIVSNFINFFRTPKINNSYLSNDKKELKMKLGQIQEEISKASLSVSTHLSNDSKSIILESDQRKIYPS